MTSLLHGLCAGEISRQASTMPEVRGGHWPQGTGGGRSDHRPLQPPLRRDPSGAKLGRHHAGVRGEGKEAGKGSEFRAIQDENYANTGYETDLSKEKLYADVSERYKL